MEEKKGRVSSKISDNEEFKEDLQQKKNKEITKYKETFVSIWGFRIFVVLFVSFVIATTIHIEMQNLKKDKASKDTAVQMTEDFYNAMKSAQDAWNTMYYFYQSGDLFDILQCRKAKDYKNNDDSDNLVVLYKKSINKNINDELKKDIQCNKKTYINVGIKESVEDVAENKELQSFMIGEEPIDLLSKYPLIKYALYNLKNGEKATFVALQNVSTKKNSLKQQTIYELELLNQDNYDNNKLLPPYMLDNSSKKAFLDISKQITCGSLVLATLEIKNAQGKTLYKPEGMIKFIVGKNTFNTAIENLLLKLKSSQKVKIFLTNNFFENSKIIPNQLFQKNQLLIIDLHLISTSV